MARASQSGSCEHGYRDQCSRRKFKPSHLISSLYMKSHEPVFERHFCSFAHKLSLASGVMTRAIAQREGMCDVHRLVPRLRTRFTGAPLELRWYCACSSQIKTQPESGAPRTMTIL